MTKFEELTHRMSDRIRAALSKSNTRKKGPRRKKPKFPHIYMFPLVFVYFEIVLRICSGTGVFSHLIYPVIFGLSVGFFFSCITSLFSKKVNRIISTVILFGSGLLFVTECLVKRSFQWYMPLDGILGGAGDVAGAYLSEALRAILHGLPAIILFFLPGVLYVIYGKKYIPARHYKPIGSIKLICYSLVFMLFGVITANIGSSGPKYQEQYKFDTATEYFGLMTSLRLEAKYSIFGNDAANDFVFAEAAESDSPENASQEGDSAGNDSTDAITPEEETVSGKNEMDLQLDAISANTSNEDIQALNTYVNSLTASSKNEYTGIFEGKNLILICAEAFSDAVISEELTPTLYRMTHNGFYFSDYYQPNWGGSTSTGEYSFLMGLVPLHSEQTMLETQGKNLYFTMGNQLQRLGYYSCAYHSGNYDYYSRNLTHTNLGYSQYLGLGNGLEDITDWWPDDERLFDLTMDTYINNQPFSIYYMTLSGHCVYNEESEYTQENLEYVRSILGNRYKDTTTYYFCYQMELEYALQTMIEKLEAAGIADDTVICLTADHYPYGLEDTATFGNSEDYVGDLYGTDYPETDWDLDRNAWIIWSGCLENEYKDMVCEISTPTYSLDILPTLSNLFGLEYDSRLLVGRDVFSDAEPLALWNTYSWVTTEGKYDAYTDTFYPNEGSTADDAYVQRIHNIVSNKISFSSKAIENDYYGVLFGSDDIT